MKCCCLFPSSSCPNFRSNDYADECGMLVGTRKEERKRENEGMKELKERGDTSGDVSVFCAASVC